MPKKRFDLRKGEVALEEFIGAHPRGWGALVDSSDFSNEVCFSRGVWLFRNSQKEWNVLKKVVKHLDKLENDKPITGEQLQELWHAYRNPAHPLQRLKH